MPKTEPRVVTTLNKKLGADFTFQDPRLPEDYEMPKDANVAVLVDVPVPESYEEACAAPFYTNEGEALKALQNDCARVRTNAVRPVLREAESPDFDFMVAGQQAIDTYAPGRRGGFQPRVTEDEIEDIDDVEELKAFLARRGVLGARATAAV